MRKGDIYDCNDQGQMFCLFPDAPVRGMRRCFHRRFRAFCAEPPEPRKRIALYYGGHLRGYVAPKQEREFLRELKKRCKNARFIPEETD